MDADYGAGERIMSQTRLSPPDAAMRRFLIVQFAVLGAFALVMMATTAVIPRAEMVWQRWLFAAGPVALLLVWAWEFFRVIRVQDEMMQAIHLRAVAIAAGLVLLGASLWGIPERLLDAPELPASMLLPIFAVVYGALWKVTGGRQ
jgi:hypothetical protein